MSPKIKSINSSFDYEEKKIENPKLANLIDYVNNTERLTENTLESISWNRVEEMMPPFLKGKSKDDIKQLLLAELDGMSTKRIQAVLKGEPYEEESSSEDETEEEIEEKEEEEEEKVEEEEKEQITANIEKEDGELSDNEIVQKVETETTKETKENQQLVEEYESDGVELE